MPRHLDRKRQGEVAELAFAHKAAALGFTVSKPYGDSTAYDVIVDWKGKLTRVQVKSTNQLVEGGYFLNAQRRLRWGTCPYKRSELDVIVAYVAPEDCWYVIPLEVVLPKKSLRLYPHRPKNDGRYGRYREAWDLMRRRD